MSRWLLLLSLLVVGGAQASIDADQLRKESADSYLTYTLRSLQPR